MSPKNERALNWGHPLISFAKAADHAFISSETTERRGLLDWSRIIFVLSGAEEENEPARLSHSA
jgi:hypothetical protein